MNCSIRRIPVTLATLLCSALLACGGLACEEILDSNDSLGSPDARGDADTVETSDLDDLYKTFEGRFIDTHNHLIMQMQESCEFEDAAADTIDFMDRHGIAMTLVMPQPGGHETPCPVEGIYDAIAAYPDRFAMVDGGGSLSAMILSTSATDVTQADIDEFRATAYEIVDLGAVAFGELTAEHFSFEDWHAYLSAPANHPLFLELADIGAETGLPLDIHMEAIAYDMDFSDIDPASGANWSSLNPSRIYENLTAFEELLDYRPEADIIWVHAGWDSTGHRTPELTADLLGAHDNLYIQLRPMPVQSQLPNSLMAGGEVDQEWLQVFADYPDRFIIGMDSMYDHDPYRVDALLQAGTEFVYALPEDLRGAIAFENAIRLYGLDQVL